MIIVFLGPPGCGKGTQASKLSKKKSIPVVSTGDILRSKINSDDELSKYIKQIISEGSLVPDNIVIELLKQRIQSQDCDNGFIIDGFPRNWSQVMELEALMHKINRQIGMVFNFQVSEDILVKRIAGRFSCKNCGENYNKFFKKTAVEKRCDSCGGEEFLVRADDNEETVKNRFRIYNNENYKIIDFYKKNNLLISIDALKDIDSVYNEIVSYCDLGSILNA